MKGSEGDGYVITTAKDISRWMQAQLGMLELPADLANAVTASQEASPGHAPAAEPSEYYFNGWVHMEPDSRLPLHSGMNPNFTAMIIIDPDAQTGVFAVSNIAASTSSYAAYSLYANLTGKEDGYMKIEPFVF